MLRDGLSAVIQIGNGQRRLKEIIRLTAKHEEEHNAYMQPAFTSAYFAEFKHRGTPMHAMV
jgi:hypothetical protein